MSQIAKVRQCGVRVANVSQRNVVRKVKIGIIYFPTSSVVGPSLYVNLNYCSVYVGGPIIS